MKHLELSTTFTVTEFAKTHLQQSRLPKNFFACGGLLSAFVIWPPQTKFLDPPLNAADIFATVGLATDAERFYWSLVRSTSVFPRLFLPPIFWKLLSFVGFCVHSGSSQRLIRVLCTIILALNSNLLCRYMLT